MAPVKVKSVDETLKDEPTKEAPQLVFSESGIMDFEQDLKDAVAAAEEEHRQEELRKIEEAKAAEEAKKKQEEEWAAFEAEQASEQAQLLADLQSGKIQENVFRMDDDTPEAAPAPTHGHGPEDAEDLEVSELSH
jgi:hypothetical protein